MVINFLNDNLIMYMFYMSICPLKLFIKKQYYFYMKTEHFLGNRALFFSFYIMKIKVDTQYTFRTSAQSPFSLI